MATLAVYDAMMEKVGEYEAPDSVFSVPPKEYVLYEVVKWQLAKRRAGTSCTKTRSEVSGGGSKPWRQKGTGRARSGSNTSPVWRRGGAIFGPKPRDYSYQLPKKVRSLALRMALSSKLMDGNLFVVRDFGLTEIKTSVMSRLLQRFGIEKAVIVSGDEDRNLELSSRNIPHITVLPVIGLNVYDIIKHHHLLIHESVMPAIEERLRP